VVKDAIEARTRAVETLMFVRCEGDKRGLGGLAESPDPEATARPEMEQNHKDHKEG